MIRPRHMAAFLVAGAIALAGCRSNANFAGRVETPDWPEFQNKVNDYTALVDRLEAKLPPLPDRADAHRITEHKSALGDAVRSERAGAQQGDIFTPAARGRFIEVIRTELRGPEGKAARNTIKESNPRNEGPTPVKLAVNAPYPDSAPLSTVPPTLLLRLPQLPKSMEYRFVGKALVLRDVRADLIADYIPDAIA